MRLIRSPATRDQAHPSPLPLWGVGRWGWKVRPSGHTLVFLLPNCHSEAFQEPPS